MCKIKDYCCENKKMLSVCAVLFVIVAAKWFILGYLIGKKQGRDEAIDGLFEMDEVDELDAE